MPTSTDVTNLKINTLTEAQYDTAVQGGVIGANELSIITDLDNAIQVAALPTASASEEGKIYQFTGTTTANYTNGYFYKCVSDGQTPATYSWTQVNVQPAPVIPDPLPSQTGNAGKFLTTDGTDASWAAINALTNNATQPASSLAIEGNAYNTWDVAIGKNSSAYKTQCIAVGGSASSYSAGGVAVGNNSGTFNESADYFIAIGYQATIGANAKGAIQIGKGTNSTAGTMSVGLTTNGTTWNNYELLSADGTIPKERLANVVTTPSTMPTLAVADWSSNTQTVNVTGVTATNTVFVSPAPASAADYASAGIICTSQGSGTLTFTCTTTPTNAITVNVVILG